MFDSLKARFLLIFALVALSAWTLYDRGIILGLDLRGGTHLALEVRDPSNALTPEDRADAVERALQIIRTRVDELGVAEPSIAKIGEDRISVELPGATEEDQRRAKDVIQKTAFLQFQIVQPASVLEPVLPRLDRLVAERFRSTAPAARQQTPAPGLGGIFERGTGADSAAAADTSAAARDTALAARPFSSKLIPAGAGPTGTALGQFAVADADVPEMERYLADPAVQAALPRSAVLRWGFESPGAEEQPGYRMLYLLDARPLINGTYLEDAQAQRDPQFNRPLVTFQLNRRGGRIFEKGTGENVGQYMAIVLDERVHSAPVINSQIGDRGQIEMGGGSIEEARDLALVLRAGALPVPIEIVEERSIGPSLGADSISKGQTAGLIGVALVIFFMILYYRVSGVLAVAALALYVLYTLGLLSGIRAALTFPGIAGLVLSVGMAVDANVLIYERIREELLAGRNVRTSVNEGFRNALPAIIDSNLTTLITSLILYQFGTGPVRGFAVTLALGIIASMFTAIFVTRTFFMLYLDRRPSATAISI